MCKRKFSEDEVSIPGYEGLYTITEDGDVWGVDRVVQNKNGGITRVRGIKRKTHKNWCGYDCIKLCKNGKLKGEFIHRLVLLAFVGPCLKGMQTRHLDGDKLNNHLSNLQYGTGEENWEDRRKHGNAMDGIDHPNSKLTKEISSKIMEEYHSSGISQKDLGAKYGLSQTSVWRIVSQKHWTDNA